MKERGDRGETLVEILLTVVIIGLSVAALVSSLATVSSAGAAQRNGVRADVVIRSYAEAIKAATQGCAAGASYSVSYTAPAGFTVSVAPATTACPPVTNPQVLTLSVTGPNGITDRMQMKVSTP